MKKRLVKEIKRTDAKAKAISLKAKVSLVEFYKHSFNDEAHMKFREPRVDVPKRTYWQETVLLCHPKMLLIIMCLTTMGHFLSPTPFDITRYVLGMAGVCVGILGVYRYNEIKDKTTAPGISSSHNFKVGTMFILVATLIGCYLMWEYGMWLALLVFSALIIMIAYNISSHPWIHNKAIYGYIWGFVPLVYSEILASLRFPTGPTLVFGAWAMLMASLTLYLWGPTTCGRLGSCSKAKGRPIKHKCHSPVLRCRDRVIMPKEINDHMKVLIGLNDAQVIVLTIAVVTMKLGGM